MSNWGVSGAAVHLDKANVRWALRRIAFLAIPLAGIALQACSSDPSTEVIAPTADGAASLDGANPEAESDGWTDADGSVEVGPDAAGEAGSDAGVEAGADADASMEDAPGADADASAEGGPPDAASDAAEDTLPDSSPDGPDAVDADAGTSDAGPGDAASDGPILNCTGNTHALKLTQVFDGVPGVLFLAAPQGDNSRLFLVQQTGRIRVARHGVLLTQPFLDVSGIISSGGERGLLGLALHPAYATNGRFWINYTDAGGDTVVAEYRRSTGNDNVADPTPVRTLLTVDQPEANHNGGMIAFGPDGYLYVGMGDGGGSGDPLGNGQDLATKLGKMLRVDVDDYPVPPPGNLSGPQVDPQIWAYGLRNPWRFSFDSQTGDLYIGDVGQGSLEEVDVASAGVGGQNYGWNVMEGMACYPSGTTCDPAGLTLPVVDYDHGLGCSITGGYVYRGTAIPCLRGRYLYGDYCSGRVFSLVWSGGVAQQEAELTDDLQSSTLVSWLTSFGQGADGELYVCSGGTGLVYRIDAESTCGDGVREGIEECDSTDVASCATGLCNTNCTCVLPGQPLPDLVPTILDISTEFDATVPAGDVAEGCAGSTAGNDLVRFAVLSSNDGAADLLFGSPRCPECETHPSAICGDPRFECAPASGHHHAHYSGFALYELLDSSDAVVAVGHKQGYCARDNSCPGGVTPKYDCDYQGITAGCTDVYAADLGCQYIDVSNVPSGEYTIRVRLDPYSRIPEADETNNETRHAVTIVRPGP